MNLPTPAPTMLASQPPAACNAFLEAAADGVPLGGFSWRHPSGDKTRAVVIINAATSVRCRHYSRFADYLFANGLDVIVYDYRGIGESRPASLRGFQASWTDWGARDFEAILQRALREFPGQPIDVVGHSFGGCAAGLADSAVHIRRVVTVGAQFAYWRDYSASVRWRMLGKWHLFMPLLTRCCGYFPGKRLGWLEDTPAGVVADWSYSTANYETRASARHLGALPFASIKADLLAISLSDDPFGTVAAIERLLGYFKGCRRTHLRLAPEDIGELEVGHFAFFRSLYRENLWPIALHWLRHGRLAAETPGQQLPYP